MFCQVLKPQKTSSSDLFHCEDSSERVQVHFSNPDTIIKVFENIQGLRFYKT